MFPPRRSRDDSDDGSSSSGSKKRYGEYVTYFKDDFVEDLGWEWESTASGRASVLLPPPPPPGSGPSELPKSIIHFVGGTVFGSYPQKFYSDLLMPIAEQTSSVVIATNIPVTLNRNPLNHLALSKRIVSSFREAFFDILCDEYGGADALKNVPIVGIGHSLGARLQVVINTNERLYSYALPRAGNVLIGFNNYGAVQSVPGVRTLRKGAADREKYVNDMNRRKYNGERYDDEFDFDDDDYDDDDDAYLDEVKDFFGLVGQSMKSALTPSDLREGNLEFKPTPDDVWSDVSSGVYGNRIERNLVVQFDRDRICQGARLSRCLGEALRENDANNKKDVKYARLPGVHLTPASFNDGLGLTQALATISGSPSSFDAVFKDMIGEQKRNLKSKAGRRREESELEALVSTISQFIREIS